MLTKKIKTRVTATHSKRKEALEVAWDKVHLLVKKTIHQWMRRHGKGMYSFEELEEIANIAFVETFDKYNERKKKASYPTYVRWVTWMSLQEYHRRSARHDNRMVCTDELPEREAPQFDLVAFYDDLSEDAQYVARLSLAPTSGLRHCIKRKQGNSGQNVKSVFREYLLGLEWTTARITAAFQEIRQALS